MDEGTRPVSFFGLIVSKRFVRNVRNLQPLNASSVVCDIYAIARRRQLLKSERAPVTLFTILYDKERD
jgi:hypothetical protein